MPRVAVEELKQRKNYHRDKYYFVLKSLYINLLLIVVLLLLISYFLFNRPAQRFYTTNSAGLVAALTPLDHPNLSDKALMPPDPPSDNATTPKNMNFDVS